jgi:transposase-like protein
MSEKVQRVEAVASVQRRRRCSVAQKIRLVEEALEPGMSVSFVARKHGLSAESTVKRRQPSGRERSGPTTWWWALPGCPSSRSGSGNSSVCSAART